MNIKGRTLYVAVRMIMVRVYLFSFSVSWGEFDDFIEVDGKLFFLPHIRWYMLFFHVFISINTIKVERVLV